MKRIFWFSPLPPARTDIANYTLRLASELQRHAEILFCYPGDTPPSCRLPMKAIRSLRPVELNGADLCIYHLGNNAEFHGEIWDCADHHPGLVVLHDRALHECYLGRPGTADPSRYLKTMAAWYGEAGCQAGLGVYAGGLRAAEQASDYPLYEPALEQAMGVLTHNRAVAVELGARFPLLPVLDLPLPYPRPAHVPLTRSSQDKQIRLVAFGFMARNRRLVEFLRAWATSPWRERFVLDLAGEINDADRVARVLAETGLDARVKRHGFVTEVQLDKLLASADLALNLRNPTMGEASGSQLRIWAARRASVVSHIGWYGQLPDDCVLKIDPAQEETELRSLLARLAQGQVDLGALAEAGWRRLAAHDPAEYVQALLGWFEREQVRLGRLWTARRQIDVLAKHQAALFPVDGTVMLPELLAQL